MVHVMASIVVRPEQAAAARSLLADLARASSAGPMFAAPPEIVAFTRVDAA